QEPGREKLGAWALLPLIFGLGLSSALAERIGIHALFGAFLFVAIIPTVHRLESRHLQSAETAVRFFLLPAFFAITGLRTDIWGLTRADLPVLALVLFTASAGKFIGAALAGKLT